MCNTGWYNVGNYAVIILAAGSSSRLGRPKQLLPYKNKTLLQHSIDVAQQIKPVIVGVVLGSNKKVIKATLSTTDLLIVENKDWESGIASSITSGLTAVKYIQGDIDAVILMVCDQPFVNAEILNQILQKQAETGGAIVGCSYEGTKGTPALFHSSFFPDLLSLKGDVGAKKLFEKYNNSASFVLFKGGGIDIDTSEDYKNLTK